VRPEGRPAACQIQRATSVLKKTRKKIVDSEAASDKEMRSVSLLSPPEFLELINNSQFY